MIISDIITLVLGVIIMQTFSSIIFVNCILHVYVVVDPPLKSVFIPTWREIIVIKPYKCRKSKGILATPTLFKWTGRLFSITVRARRGWEVGWW